MKVFIIIWTKQTVKDKGYFTWSIKCKMGEKQANRDCRSEMGHQKTIENNKKKKWNIKMGRHEFILDEFNDLKWTIFSRLSTE